MRTGVQEEGGGDGVGGDGDEEGGHVARLVLALRAAQVGKELQVRVGCGEQESSDDGANRRVGPGIVQLR